MARYLTGIQSTGRPHLGNLLGAICPAIEFSKTSDQEALYFIADLHSLTTIRDAEVLKHNTYSVAAAWLAMGLDTDRHILYRQSDVPMVTELSWYLNCFAPFPMLANAHSFKDKSSRRGLADVNAGLFTYPVLMAADILMYDANFVPVGKDQVQHLEIARDIASSFNHIYGETFVLPEAKTDDAIMTIPGINGEKMSKSYGNIIDIFEADKPLRKTIMSIVTDSTPLEEPKNPDDDTTFALYRLLATPEDVETMRQNYLTGGYGYGHAKQALYETIIGKYSKERELFTYYMNNLPELDKKLQEGAEKAKAIATPVLQRVRQKLGY
ncbi:tryptophan--tRNA ligase [Pontibacter sp. BT310]|uniref:Tryptophan--tRNA ligase n=1 Tax=Pontibacter populi TaxID=890055 RepID=A0ABS6XBT9_9BACT|nr:MULTISPECIES: tryptophan--tRNA ligase [Pontibacter]MBJ6118604.1 tryptophan--tRNA ligase [Pontibacter sp. BT310]MBR0571033.1 tryptophan--tRNA ligase [Microvirga sp. STS03]MBW3365458.1 tryptophan--tRNA ligase [Pontibacter populi]